MSLRVEMHEYGGPDVLTCVEREPDTPGPGEVRVSVTAAGVNRADLFIRAGTWTQGGPWPYVPGLELVGTVEALGDDVPFRVGDRVITMMQRLGGIHGLRAGGYQARAVVPADTLALLPKSLSSVDAATLGLPAVTAYLALRRLGLQAGQRVLIHAGSSAVGQVAIRLARLSGADIVVSGRRSARFGALIDAGADEVLDTSREDWARAVLPVDRVLDLVGRDTFPGTLKILAAGGRVLVAGATSGPELPLSAWDLMRGVEITGWSSESLDRDGLQAAVDVLARLVERGLLALPPCTSFALGDAALAHGAMEAGQVLGRVLLRP